MSRIINESITVHLGANSAIETFIWRRRLYRVINILSWWREPSQWWNGESKRFLVRVTATNLSPGIYELCKADDGWFLHSLLD
jgi:hypothetical protein